MLLFGILSVVKLTFAMLSDILPIYDMLIVIILIVIILIVIMLSVIMLNIVQSSVVMLSVKAGVP